MQCKLLKIEIPSGQRFYIVSSMSLHCVANFVVVPLNSLY